MKPPTTTSELIQMHRETCEAARSIMEAKNHDYSGNNGDPFANFRASKAVGIEPELGILMRCMDKFARITTFIQSGKLKVKAESCEDAISDVINYMILLQGMIRERTYDYDPFTDEEEGYLSNDVVRLMDLQTEMDEKQAVVFAADLVADDARVMGAEVEKSSSTGYSIDVLNAVSKQRMIDAMIADMAAHWNLAKVECNGKVEYRGANPFHPNGATTDGFTMMPDASAYDRLLNRSYPSDLVLKTYGQQIGAVAGDHPLLRPLEHGNVHEPDEDF